MRLWSYFGPPLPLPSLKGRGQVQTMIFPIYGFVLKINRQKNSS